MLGKLAGDIPVNPLVSELNKKSKSSYLIKEQEQIVSLYNSRRIGLQTFLTGDATLKTNTLL